MDQPKLKFGIIGLGRMGMMHAAIFNSLPIIPLDGGFIFNDTLDIIIKKFKKDMKSNNREKLIKRISLIFSLIILFLVLFPVIFRYI